MNGEYAGSCFAKEQFADSRPCHTDFLAALSEARKLGSGAEARCLDYYFSIGMTPEKARAKLDFFERFPPEQAHKRLVAHRVEVYRIKSPKWVKRGRLFMPQGGLEEAFAIDLGTEIPRLCEEETLPGTDLGEFQLDLGDGTLVVGKRVRISPSQGTARNRIVENPFLSVSYDSSSFQSYGNFIYSFGITKSAITAQEPKQYSVTTYVLIDSQLVQETREVARPLFSLRKDGHYSLAVLRFSKN